MHASNSAGSSNAVSLPTGVIAAKPPKSVSLSKSQPIVVYGRSVLLSGSVKNGQPGEPVTITEQRLPAVGGIQAHAVATVKTTTDGSFSLGVRPVIRTLYKATAGQTSSNEVSVRVRPLVRLKHLGPHRFLVRALAARSFVGKFGALQRWSVRRHAWVSVRMVLFRSAFVGVAPTTTSRAVFRTRLDAVKIRIAMPRSQTAPGYIAGFSNAVTA